MELNLETIKNKVSEFFSPSEAPPPEGFVPLEESQPPDGFSPLEETQSPVGFEPLLGPSEEEGVQKTIGRKMRERFLGEDVDDPIELPRLASQMSFAVAGGILGSRIPTAPGLAGYVINPVTGAAVGGMAGLALGTFAPETALYIAAETGVIDEAQREKLSLSPSELRTVLEGEALLELLTGGTLLGIRTGGRYFGRTLAGVGEKESKVAERAHGLGIPLMPIHVGNSVIGRGYVSVLGRFPWISGPLVKHGSEAEEALGEVVKTLPGRLAPLSSWSDVSKRMYDEATGLVDGIGRIFDKKYGDLWARADGSDAWVAPRKTVEVGQKILNEIAQQTPQTSQGPGSPGKILEKVRDFVNGQILVMRDETGNLTAQSFKQVDGLLSGIDQEIALMEPGARRHAASLLERLKISAQSDVALNSHGADAAVLSKEWQALDKEFSETVASLFETAAAKRFGSVEKRGLRGIAWDKATRTPVDQLASKVLMLDSPQAVEELHRIVTPETFKRITAHVFADAIDNAMVTTSEIGRKFDVESFSSHLGLDRLISDRRLAVGKMLELSGSPITVKELDEIVEAARTIRDTEIPHVSKFLARGAVIGGAQHLLNALIPGLGVAGAAGSGVMFGLQGLLGVAMFTGGGRLVSSMIANPESARALLKTMDKEASRLVRREAFIRALRVGIEAMSEGPDEPTAKFYDPQQMRLMVGKAVEAMDRQMNMILGE